MVTSILVGALTPAIGIFAGYQLGGWLRSKQTKE